MLANLKNKKKVQNAWAMYDWANSVYSLVITSTIFPVYYNSVTKGLDDSDIVSFFGFEIINTVLYSYSISFSFLIIAIISPLLSGMADSSGKKLEFMKFFAYLGSAACVGLYFFDASNVEWGIICSITASIGYAGSIVFYNAYLPEISEEKEYDLLSAKGFALGYVGSVILLVVNLLMIQMPHLFGIPDGGVAARLSFLITGIWWAGFSQIPFRILPKNPYNRKLKRELLFHGYQEIRKVFFQIREIKVMIRFLASFFFYSMGVQTTMYLAATFGDKELGLPGDQLIMTVLIIQFVAIIGSYLFAFISKKYGNKVSLVIMVLIWTGICAAAYYVYTVYEFFALAFVVGMVMGGIQSLSRSTYSKLIPRNTTDHASFFSFYDVTEKMAIVLGTFSYGVIEQLTGNMRNSALSLGIFFLVGLGFLLLVSIPKQELSHSMV
ncbi:MAG TPA: MFS transporter [Algoriphagus sp.]|jgi:UMF1 family MFS transporter|uniref:MFS transporter n=3 Tax=Algoriphagus TaxID=246875 RepID=UPI000C5E9186|nr:MULTISPECIES: MFS transporter [unclassified Algoriphagus]MAL15117.1 MFS transporter [Algoriphagus sp.]MAN87882.1 MFS transporter [Algoriphagus sp.]HAD51665.1 MFS transporter [Algoriphagus sp.]HAH37600.1 MFS transporter [Algoriphagus sp.]HAS57285.1 MFS transporter [Algoriphagus sp.]|tara:strand:- start:5298 stop:6611 length:1314 start_codon:yes stop_codon:yes gene_type:complete